MWVIESNSSGIYEVEFPLYDQIVRFQLPARNKQHALTQALARWLKRQKLSVSKNIGLETRKWEDRARITRIGDDPEQQQGKLLPEDPPLDPQLSLPGIQAFDKTTDKTHPAASVVENWKKSRKMRFLTFDQLAELIGKEQAVISVKLDGELVALVLTDGRVEAITSKGTIRTNFPAADETAKLLGAKYKNAMIMGEMYVVNENEVPQSYMKAATVLRDPHSEKDELIRLAIFDVMKLDDVDYEEKPIEEKMALIADLTKGGKLVQPAYTVIGGIAEAQKLWKQLEEKGWEGLVVHVGDQMYKVKPIMSYDLVVVAIEKSAKYQDRMGAVLAAFRDKESRFRMSGSIGGGFSDEERRTMYDWALRNKVYEDDERIWVDPFKEPLVIEIEAVEVNLKNRPAMTFKDRKWVEIEQDMSGVFRFPQFVRVRDDKKPEHPDVRIEQLPIQSMKFIASQLEPGRRVKVISGQWGKIMNITTHAKDSFEDCVLLVRWDSPLFGEIESSACHMTEVIEIQ